MSYEGSLRGSGFYAEDVVIDFTCEAEGCDFDEKIDATTDDWGNVGWIECPKCGTDVEYVVPEPDYDDRGEWE